MCTDQSDCSSSPGGPLLYIKVLRSPERFWAEAGKHLLKTPARERLVTPYGATVLIRPSFPWQLSWINRCLVLPPLVTIGYGKPWSFIVPGQRTYFPSSISLCGHSPVYHLPITCGHALWVLLLTSSFCYGSWSERSCQNTWYVRTITTAYV